MKSRFGGGVFLLYNSCTIISKLYAAFDAINIVCIFGKQGGVFSQTPVIGYFKTTSYAKD